MERQYCTQIPNGEIAPYVLLPGDPGRVPKVASLWDKGRKVSEAREYTAYTGTYKGMPISCVSTGIGCPSTAIALEELARVGAHTFIRIGTCGTFQDGVENGDMAIFDSAMRYDGTSTLYAPLEYPAVSHHAVLQACIDAGKALGVRYHVGTTRTTDTFYARHPHPGSSFNNYWQSNWRHYFEDLKRMNVLAAEMETSIILVLAKIWGLRAGGMAVVLDNVFKVSGENKDFNPEEALDHSEEHIMKLCRMGCEAMKSLYESDKRR